MYVAFGYKSEFIGLFTTKPLAFARMQHVYRNLATLTLDGECVRFIPKPDAHTSWGEPRRIEGIHGSITWSEPNPTY